MSHSRVSPWIPVTGLLLLGGSFLLRNLARSLGSGGMTPVHAALGLFVWVFVGGMVYVWISRRAVRVHGQGRLLGVVLLVGLAMRLFQFGTEPSLEDDVYRYLWDGAVVVHGLNPYAHSPAEVLERTVPELAYARLARDGRTVLSKINHPRLRTLYPPVAQLAFAAAHRIRPWSIDAWRGVLLLADLVGLGLILGLLDLLKLPRGSVVVYWWNPLLIREVYNAGHLDVLLVPFVMGAFFLALRGRRLASLLSLALASGVKLWPLVLFPLLWKKVSCTWTGRLRIIIFSVVLVVLILGPLALTGIGAHSGLVAYAQRWEGNDAFFRTLRAGTAWVLPHFHIPAWRAGKVARGIVFVVCVVLTVGLVQGRWTGGREWMLRAGMVTAVFFLLSPTQYPWYFLWILPFLVFVPWMPLLVLSATMGLYELRHVFLAWGRTALFDYGVVWLEYLPVLVGVVLAWLHRSRWKAERRDDTSFTANIM